MLALFKQKCRPFFANIANMDISLDVNGRFTVSFTGQGLDRYHTDLYQCTGFQKFLKSKKLKQ